MPRTIASLQNRQVKDAVRLRDHRGRRRQGRIIIDGARELIRAIDGGIELLQVFVCDAIGQQDAVQGAMAAVSKTDARVRHVTPDVFAKLAFGQRAEGIVGVAQTPRRTLEALSVPEGALIAVLEMVEKPGNVGAVLRSADGAGISALVVADGRTDLYNPNAIRASLGTIFTVPVCEATSAETFSWLRERNLPIYAARVDGTVEYVDVDFTSPAAIVLGSETTGLSDIWRRDHVTAVRLPMLGVADSLNVSAAAAVLFYEALRQRSR